ncbi:MAG: MBL fold metallo-hydrolase [bacterium]|nr:MAG: MBL fold metallo-hydrolase [bacterium]
MKHLTCLRHVFLISFIFFFLLFATDLSFRGICMAGFLACSSPTGQNNSNSDPSTPSYSIKINILYDNTVFKSGTTADWGFSCLVEGMEDTVLFDTGTQGAILQHNLNELQVDVSTVDQIVLSHNHGDHTGAILTVLGQHSDVVVNLPQSFDQMFIDRVINTGASVHLHQAPDSICSDICLSGEMGQDIREQSLILDTDSGLVVITGCSHPGIVSILERARQIRKRPIYLVVGGFHLMNHSTTAVQEIIDEFQNLNVKYVAPTHCTGEEAISLFRNAYENFFIQAGTGRVIYIP